jgi:hypothetical protein
MARAAPARSSATNQHHEAPGTGFRCGCVGSRCARASCCLLYVLRGERSMCVLREEVPWGEASYDVGGASDWLRARIGLETPASCARAARRAASCRPRRQPVRAPATARLSYEPAPRTPNQITIYAGAGATPKHSKRVIDPLQSSAPPIKQTSRIKPLLTRPAATAAAAAASPRRRRRAPLILGEARARARDDARGADWRGAGPSDPPPPRWPRPCSSA